MQLCMYTQLCCCCSEEQWNNCPVAYQREHMWCKLSPPMHLYLCWARESTGFNGPLKEAIRANQDDAKGHQCKSTAIFPTQIAALYVFMCCTKAHIKAEMHSCKTGICWRNGLLLSWCFKQALQGEFSNVQPLIFYSVNDHCDTLLCRMLFFLEDFGSETEKTI